MDWQPSRRLWIVLVRHTASSSSPAYTYSAAFACDEGLIWDCALASTSIAASIAFLYDGGLICDGALASASIATSPCTTTPSRQRNEVQLSRQERSANTKPMTPNPANFKFELKECHLQVNYQLNTSLTCRPEGFREFRVHMFAGPCCKGVQPKADPYGGGYQYRCSDDEAEYDSDFLGDVIVCSLARRRHLVLLWTECRCRTSNVECWSGNDKIDENS